MSGGEEQVHSIKVVKENLSGYDTGGGYRVVDAVVTIDSSIHPRLQRIACAYEILGIFLGITMSTDDLNEIAVATVDGLEELEADNANTQGL